MRKGKYNSRMIDWSSFLQDLIIEFIGVILFGGFMALVLYYQTRRLEQKRSQEISDEAKLKYLRHMYDEIKVNLDKIPLESEDARGGGRILFELSRTTYQSTYWDCFVPSGLLPSLLDYSLLKGIADFYHSLKILDIHFAHINQISLEASIRVKDPRDYILKYTVEMLSPHIEKTHEQGFVLLEEIEQEINRLQRIV